MKKVMIAMLILIPVLILVIVAMVSNFIIRVAWISVDDLLLYEKGTELTETPKEIEELGLSYPTEDPVLDINDYVFVKVMPEQANKYTFVWSIDEIEYMDEKYESDRKAYLDYLNEIEKIREDVYDDETIYDKETEIERRVGELKDVKETKPAAILVDDDGNEVAENSTGKLSVLSYCTFSLTVQAETIHKTLHVTVGGDDVQSIEITNKDDDNVIKLGETLRLEAKRTPASSLVSVSEWTSSDENVVKVDKNGVLTAVGVGESYITNRSNWHSDATHFVESEPLKITVVEANAKYSGTLYTSKNQMTIAEDLGLDMDSVESMQNLEVDAIDRNLINLTANSGRITFKDSTTLDIVKCDSQDIAIEHADIYSNESGYVVAVSDLKFILKAIWKDAFAANELTGVAWATSNSEIATVETLSDGSASISAKSSGLVNITATKDGRTATITLNMQIKVVSMQLRTSQNALKVGLAQETVFAAEKFDGNGSNTVPNTLAVEIVGAPKRLLLDKPVKDPETGEEEIYAETLDEFNKRLREYYSAYKFEITEGSEYGYFENADNMFANVNVLHFLPSALEGKGRQVIKVKVSAKYPVYEGTYTTKIVDISVIYGVEVNTAQELKMAVEKQGRYALNGEGNNIYGNQNAVSNDVPKFEYKHTLNGTQTIYRQYYAPTFRTKYAVCFGSDIINDDGNGNLLITGANYWASNIRGDVYGNNKLFSAPRGAKYDGRYREVLRISSSDVTFSNLRFRANELGQNGDLSAEDAANLRGICIDVLYEGTTQLYMNYMQNVNIEYCVFENVCRGLSVKNVDLSLTGCIFRNISTAAIFDQIRMEDKDDTRTGEKVVAINASDLKLHNTAFANIMGLTMSVTYEYMSVKPDNSSNKYTGRFVEGNDEASRNANAEIFIREIYDKGASGSLQQTGFMDIYNWQDTSKSGLVQTGYDQFDAIIQAAVGPLVRYNSAFKDIVKIYEDETDEDEDTLSYVHIGFTVAGMQMSDLVMDEPVFLNVEMEDKRFAKPVCLLDVKQESNDGGASGLVNKLNLTIYSYSTSYNETLAENGDSTAILPRGKGLTITPQYIARLHTVATSSDAEEGGEGEEETLSQL